MERQRRQIVLENPTLEMALEAVKSGISKRRTVMIVGDCTVSYEGRASSKLEKGERIVLLKSDGSAQVHRPRDYAPVNWQPPGSLFRTRLEGQNLILRVFRKKEYEVLEVIFGEIILITALDLRDVGAFNLYASEEDMQRAILIQPSLLEDGFRPITVERPVEPGFIDILGRDSNGVLTVVEIKRKTATKDAVVQLKKYVDVFVADESRRVRGILVAPELARGAQKMLVALELEFKALSPQVCADILRLKKVKQLTSFLG